MPPTSCQEICAVDHVACIDNRRHKRLQLTSSSELPKYTVAGQQPHDAAPEALCYSFPASRQKIPSGLAKRLCVAPAQELWPSPLAFAIGSTATDKNDRYWCHLQCQFRYNLNAFTPD